MLFIRILDSNRVFAGQILEHHRNSNHDASAWDADVPEEPQEVPGTGEHVTHVISLEIITHTQSWYLW